MPLHVRRAGDPGVVELHSKFYITVNPSSDSDKNGTVVAGEFQPDFSSKNITKANATGRNGFAVNKSQFFMAELGTPIIRVVNRPDCKEAEKVDAKINFRDKITSICLVNGGTVLAIGFESGNIKFWALTNGTVIISAQSHLQAVTVLSKCSRPGGDMLFSGSPDGVINIWDMSDVLTTNYPRSYFTRNYHKAGITAITAGYQSTDGDMLVASADSNRTILITLLVSGTIVCTFLTKNVANTLDFCNNDRSILTGFDDGSLGRLDFGGVSYLVSPGTIIPQASQAPTIDLGYKAILSTAFCIATQTLYCGHEDGKLSEWSISAQGFKESKASAFLGPITNLVMPDALTGRGTTVAERHTYTRNITVVKPNNSSSPMTSGCYSWDPPSPVVVPGRLNRPALQQFEELYRSPVLVYRKEASYANTSQPAAAAGSEGTVDALKKQLGVALKEVRKVEEDKIYLKGLLTAVYGDKVKQSDKELLTELFGN